MNGDAAELLNAAETGGVRNSEEIWKDDEFVDANREKYIKARKEMYSALVSHTNSEASTIVRCLTGTGWSRSLGETPLKLNQKNTGNNI